MSRGQAAAPRDLHVSPGRPVSKEMPGGFVSTGTSAVPDDACLACGVSSRADDGRYCATCDDDLSHLYALFYGAPAAAGLGFCGCGCPDEAYALVRDILAAAAGRYGEDGRWNGWPAPHPVLELTGDKPGVFWFVLYAIDAAGLTEHGTSAAGFWPTDKGRHYLSLMRRLRWADVAESGSPHDGGECTPDCRHWRASHERPAA
jgi:hypothetical protein